mgnify:CR=1 FL=1
MFVKKSHWIFGGALILALTLLALPERLSHRLKVAVGSVFLPLFGLSSAADRLAGKSSSLTASRADLARENERLRAENQQLRFQIQQTQDVWRENQALRQSIGWQQQTQWKLRLARVIGRDPANWWRTLQLDLGEQEGVKPNYPVLSPAGLVGRILVTGPSRSQAVLLGDPKCRVAAQVPEAKDSGIIMPSSFAPINNEYVDLGYLSRHADLKPGQAVYTSGLGGIFPKGLLIGHIADIRSVDGLYLEARIRLAANLSDLAEVYVLFP